MTTVDTQSQQPVRMDEELKAQQCVALRKAALEHHEFPTPGKVSITPTKLLSNQRDLALAYSPGVAVACEEIVEDVTNSLRYTARGNLVGVVINGTAMFGLGDIGPEASKPVMEGKVGLFKKLIGIDVFDIEINEKDPQKLADITASLKPTFGGINLENIKVSECFFAEHELRKRMKIPVFHDDQHGMAIVVGVGIINALKVVGKDIKKVKLVASGAGAVALVCLDLLVDLGLPCENIWVTDLAGMVYEGRAELMDPDKAHSIQKTDLRILAEVIDGADIFSGLSVAGVLRQDMVKRMVGKSIIFALVNPNSEILPEQVKEVRPDVTMGTGCTDYPNRVNNVLCFPFIFRDALDVGATTITHEMEVAAVHAVAELARQEQSDIVVSAYGIQDLSFGPEYLISKPLDPHLIVKIAPAAAQATMFSGVIQRPTGDIDAYHQHLQQLVYHSGTLMKPIFSAARKVLMENRRTVFVEGEEERAPCAVQIVADETFVSPILTGRSSMIAHRIEHFGLHLREGVDFTVVSPEHDERSRDYREAYYRLMVRKGVTSQYAKLEMRRRNMLVGVLMIRKDETDGMTYGTISNIAAHSCYINQVLGGTSCVYAAMNGLILPGRQVFLTGTYISVDPTAEQFAEITIMAAEELRRFGIKPKVALMSHSNFGSSKASSAVKMRETLAILCEHAPNLEVDSETRGDAALDEKLRASLMPDSTLKGEANLLIMPNIDVANIAYNLLKATVGNSIAIGPILLSVKKSVYILTPSATM